MKLGLFFILLFSFPLAVIAQNSVSLDFAPGCEQVKESDPPFLISNPGGVGGATMPLAASSTNTHKDSYLPKDSIVELQSANNGLLNNLWNSEQWIGVKVLSVPDLERTKLDPRTGRVTQGGVASGARTVVGQSIYIQRHDLLPVTFVKDFVKPGAILPWQRTVFVVRRDSPYLNTPALKELQGRPVRLAQDSFGYYLVKRCCPTNIDNSTINASARDPRCTYNSIFELMKDDGKNLSVEKSFSIDNCNALIASMQPTNSSNLRSILELNSTMNRIKDNSLTRLQQIAWRNANEGRNACVQKNKAGQCIRRGYVQGNVSKGLCRVAVRETLEEMGWLPVHPPGSNAKDLYPWMEGQGYENQVSRYPNPGAAPAGCVLVYDGGPSGHVEIKVDENTYCSDYCSDTPITEGRLRGQRFLKGVYCSRNKR